MAKVTKLPLPSGFNNQEEVSAVIAMILMYEDQNELIKGDFRNIFSRDISGSAIDRVRTVHAAEIQKRQLALLEAHEQNPLSNSRMLLKLVYSLFRKCTSGTLVMKTYKAPGTSGTTEVKEVRGENIELALQCVRLAHRINLDLRGVKDPDEIFADDEDADEDDNDYADLG